MSGLVKIYDLSDPVTGEIRYVGKTVSTLKRRLSRHLTDARKSTSCHRTAWIRSLTNKGLEPIVRLIDEVYESEWEFWEIWYIELYKSFGFNLTNQTIGGDGVHDREVNSGSFKKGGVPWNKGTIGVCGAWNKGLTRSDETKIKISETKKRKFASGELINPRKGHKCSAEEIESIRMRHPNRSETIQLNKDTLVFVRSFNSIGKIESELGYNSANISKAIKKGWSSYGFKWISKESYDKLSSSELKLHFSSKVNTDKLRGVVQLSMSGDFIRSFPSRVSANEFIGKEPKNTSIYSACRGINSYAYGFKWMYKEDYDKTIN